MRVQIKSKQQLAKQQVKSRQQQQPQRNPIQFTDQQIKKFLKTYQLKNLTLKEMTQIYRRHALTPHFRNTMISAVITLFLPAFTNIYYTFRPNSILSKVMPFAMPVICFTQYIYVINKDLQNFCFTDTQDSVQLRQKYKILYAYSSQMKELTELVDQIKFIQGQQKNSKKPQQKVV